MINRSSFTFTRLLVLTIFGFCSIGCGIIQKKEPTPLDEYSNLKPLKPEETGELVGEVAKNWFYGEGVGDTALNVGTAVLFPPYLLVLLGNGVLDISGYETVGVSTFLPDEEAEVWKKSYSSFVSIPGRVNSLVAGEQFRTQPMKEYRLKKVLQRAGKVEENEAPSS